MWNTVIIKFESHNSMEIYGVNDIQLGEKYITFRYKDALTFKGEVMFELSKIKSFEVIPNEKD